MIEHARAARSASDRGASAVEYALLVAFIAGSVIATVAALGPLVTDLYAQATAGW